LGDILSYELFTHVEFNTLKDQENFSREPPGVFTGAWGSRVRRGGYRGCGSRKDRGRL
jgi:hypothetical protein